MIGAGNVGSPRITSASGNQKVGSGAILGILCSASAAGTITLYDDAGTGTTSKLMESMAVTAGQYLPVGLAFGAGLNMVIGGTATVTLVVA